MSPDTEAALPASIPPQVTEFIRDHFGAAGGGCRATPLAGDASTRRYFRLAAPGGESFILALYPEPFDPEKLTYRQVYTLLRGIDVPVPEAYIFDAALGIVLQQDLGDESLQKRLDAASASEREALLRQAIDLIVRIQRDGAARCDPRWEAGRLAFDSEKLSFELDFFFQHYLGGHRGLRHESAARAALYKEFDALSHGLAAAPRVLAHRDYHCRNILVTGSRLYVIDFQDARMGPASYDLVSLLKDSIDLSESEIDQWVREFLSRDHSAGRDAANFLRQFELMSVQRMLKALGTYGYQISVRGNPVYRKYLAGTIRRAYRSALRLQEFPAIEKMLEREMQG